MNRQNTTTTIARTLPQRGLALLLVGTAGIAGAGPVTVAQLDGQRALSVNRAENTLMYVTLPAASADITGMGTIDSRLSVKVPEAQGVNISLNHARNEAGTLFVYLNVDAGRYRTLHRKLPLTITNSLTGKNVTLNVQVNATAGRFR